MVSLGGMVMCPKWETISLLRIILKRKSRHHMFSRLQNRDINHGVSTTTVLMHIQPGLASPFWVSRLLGSSQPLGRSSLPTAPTTAVGILDSTPWTPVGYRVRVKILRFLYGPMVNLRLIKVHHSC